MHFLSDVRDYFRPLVKADRSITSQTPGVYFVPEMFPALSFASVLYIRNKENYLTLADEVSK